jgi:hypothetical protein
MMFLCRCLRLLHLLVLFYVLTAVLYTTKLLLFSILFPGLSQLFNGQLVTSLPWPVWHPFRASTASAVAQIAPAINEPRKPLGDVIYWNSDDLAVNSRLRENRSIPMSEDLFLSKTFAQSLQPSKIVPYFYRATGEFDPEDITITTLVTSNRFKVLAQLVSRYNGERRQCNRLPLYRH